MTARCSVVAQFSSKMAESATQNASTALYHYLCQNIVGSEEHVKTIRMINNARDHLETIKNHTVITSGSFGEGLQMRGSDLDMMAVMKVMEVSEDLSIGFNADRIYFTMELEDTQPGFTKLRLVHCKYQNIFEDCKVIGNNFYFSNSLFKQKFVTTNMQTVHGPCLSDEEGMLDYAYCLQSKLWITPATQWITRPSNSWPSYDVKQAIVQHGVIFVPVGFKGSSKEELEWRISFSVGEKLLIYSFTHTQLLCYALMKILLKDVIAIDKDCKELLCSYFIKTVLFWICEELASSIWKPENLIYCFMRCFTRLIYCVEYKVCPHYFIPENNLFENKIRGDAQKTLLNKLYNLNSYGWKCILFSDQFSNFQTLAFDISKDSNNSRVNSVWFFLTSVKFFADKKYTTFDFILEKTIHKVMNSTSSKMKYLFTYYLSKCCPENKQLLTLEDRSCNKSTYTQYKTSIHTLLLKTHHDAVSGWLRLASFFYTKKQYETALYIVQYSLLKCTQEKLYLSMKFSDIHHELLNLLVFRKMTIVQLWRFLLLDLVTLNENAMIIPDELQNKVCVQLILAPVVYAHFLRFLCHYRLQNSRQYSDSLLDLELTIKENYLIENSLLKALSYNILGISYLLLGEIESARHAFVQSTVLFQNKQVNIAFKILSLIR